MDDGGLVRGNLLKYATGPLLGIGFGALAWLWVGTFGPHGLMQPKPNCGEQTNCVIVAGLDRDVYMGFGAGNEVFGFELSDDVTERLVGQLRSDSVPTVFKFPIEIAVPQTGARDEARDLAKAFDRARELGRERHARLVVVGRVIDDRHIRIAFVDPHSGAAPEMFEHDLDSAEGRVALQEQLSRALGVGPPSPPPPTPPEEEVVSFEPPTRKPSTREGDLTGGRTQGPSAGPALPPAAGPPAPSPASAAPRSLATPARLTNPVWLERPNAADFSRYYPPRALDREQGALVRLSCLVDADGRIACTVASEDPPGWGFGEAALRISRHFRMAPATRDGEPTLGGRIEVPIRFSVAG